ncbi:MAG TPA: hypothetical protein VML19_29030 [Verrucomicrobiae bacterium]|nr:hypothetical protein [Verrucomicrobiae bacterium]
MTQCVLIGFLIFGLVCALFPQKMQELDLWLARVAPWAPNAFSGWKKTKGFTTYLRIIGWMTAIVCVLAEILIIEAQ